ncbi:MAG TPA: NERD domain-containing protein, partial [Terrabacter sp.]|nr:NERD domain-containing protein [Terrabacter sp.]
METGEVAGVADERGTAGGSARREYERRRDARDQRVRERFPRIGGFLLAVTDEPQSTRAWDTGAEG